MRELALFLSLFLVMGCYDRFHEPGLLSVLEGSVEVKGKISGKSFSYKHLKYGQALWGMVAEREFQEISVYQNGMLLYTYTSEDLNRLLQKNPHDIIIWKLSEEGISLISLEKAKEIQKKSGKK